MDSPLERSKGAFPTDDSLLKLIYLAADVFKKWAQRQRNWNLIISQPGIYFEERLSTSL